MSSPIKARLPARHWMILAGLAGLSCLLVTIRLWQAVSQNQPTWPFPALYFLQMMIMAVAAALAVALSFRSTFIWICAGIFLAFSILGSMTVGLVYLPYALVFAIIAAARDLQEKGLRAFLSHLAVFLLAAVIQAAYMIAAALLS